MHFPDEKLFQWQVTKSRYLAHKPWFTARVDTLVHPAGKTIPCYYVMEYPSWVNVIAITQEGKFVLIRQYRHGLQQVNYEIPAGVCETKDASLLESAKRELLEETGYGKGEWQLFSSFCANPATQNNLTYTFLATDVERIADQSLDETETLTVHLLAEEEVLALLQKGEIVQALMAAPLWKYFYSRREFGLTE